MVKQPLYALFVPLALSLTLVLGVASLSRMAEARTAALITVDSVADDEADDGHCTLREAIQAANTDSAVDVCAAGGGADTIAFALPPDSTITLDGSRLPTIIAALTIDGSTATNLTISGSHTSGVFEIGTGASVTMTHLTIADGNAGYGAGILNGDPESGSDSGGTLVLRDSTLISNTATSAGGGIYNNSGGTLTVANSTFSGNVAENGGGIYNWGTVTVTNSTLSSNSASVLGGGIYNYDGGTLTVINCMFSGNEASVGGGGGILNVDTVIVENSTFSGNAGPYGSGIYNADTLTVTNSTLSGNTANAQGGAIYNVDTLTMMDSTLSGNLAEQYGGGIYNYDGGMLTVTNSTLSGNEAFSGGGIYNWGTVTVTHSTLTGNTAGVGGGGIYNYDGGTVTVENSTLSSNVANSGGGIRNYSTLAVTNSTLSGNTATDGAGIYNRATVTVTHSTLSGNTATDGAGIYNGLDGVVHMTNSMAANSPLGHDCWNDGTIATFVSNLVGSGNCGSALTDDPLLSPLQDNGGATLTHALLPGSPAIDAGDEGECLATDQRGVTRPQGEGCDIGAFEAQLVIYLPLLQVDGVASGARSRGAGAK